jgi:hypothetical protein
MQEGAGGLPKRRDPAPELGFRSVGLVATRPEGRLGFEADRTRTALAGGMRPHTALWSLARFRGIAEASSSSADTTARRPKQRRYQRRPRPALAKGKHAPQPCHLRIADLDDGRGCDLLSGWRGPRLPHGQGPDPGPADAQTRRDDVVGLDAVEVLEACRAASGSMARSAASRSRNTRMRTIWS